ncbi:hypothetical protein GCM10018790_45340 [Kitasatospora xanthocidica]|nr:hypothetical protein GCM10018790_45340 [Kitasatospora xanthocidica]
MPAPLGPMKAMNSPSPTEKETSSTIGTPRTDQPSPSRLSTGEEEREEDATEDPSGDRAGDTAGVEAVRAVGIGISPPSG